MRRGRCPTPPPQTKEGRKEAWENQNTTLSVPARSCCCISPLSSFQPFSTYTTFISQQSHKPRNPLFSLQMGHQHHLGHLTSSHTGSNPGSPFLSKFPLYNKVAFNITNMDAYLQQFATYQLPMGTYGETKTSVYFIYIT